MTKDILRATVRYWVERRFRNEVSTERWPWRRNVFFCFLCTSLNLLYHKLYWRSCHCDRDTYPRSFDHKSVALPLAITELPPHPPRSTSAPSVHCRTQVVWGFVCACTGIVRNELICGYASVLHTSSSFRPHTHTHTHSHTIWGPCSKIHWHCVLIHVSKFGRLWKHPKTTQHALNECHSLHSVVETGH